MVYGGLFVDFFLWLSFRTGGYINNGGWEGGGSSSPTQLLHPTLTYLPPVLHAKALNHISMDNIYFDNINFPPTIPTSGNFNIYPSNYMLNTGANDVQQFGAFDMAQQYCPVVDPLTTFPMPINFSEYHDNYLIEWRLTCCLQAWGFQLPHIIPRAASTLSTHTPASTYRSINFNPNLSGSQAGTVAPPPGQHWNRPPFTRPPSAVRTFYPSRL